MLGDIEMIIDMTGNKYGRLTVLEYAGKKQSGKQYRTTWLCECECGNKKIIAGAELRRGKTISCGCFHKEMVGKLNRKHGLANKTKLYGVWKSMRDRCFNPKNKSYNNYGGRGITVCNEWNNNFGAFYNWAIQHGYKQKELESGRNKFSIDRINNNGNYEPNNCKFSTDKEQANNKRTNIAENLKHKKCAVCGNNIIFKQTKIKTCSRKCGFILRSITHKNITKDKYKKICPICNKEYEDRSGHFKKRIYCSQKCKSLSLSPIWEYDNKKLRVVEWAKIVNISAHCLINRVNNLGWSIEKALNTKIRRKI